MKHALGFSAVNQTLALVCSLLGCSVDNPGMSDPAKPVTWDGAVRTSPNSQGTGTGDGGAGAGIGSGNFDPSKVYFCGQFLTAENAIRYGLYDVENPTALATEVVKDGCYGKIRPTDGAIVYSFWDEKLRKDLLRVGVPDLPGTADPGSNDIGLELPACLAEATNFRWWMTPDTGELIFSCGSTARPADYQTYSDANGATLPSLNGLDILTMGYNGTCLASKGDGVFFLVGADGSRVPLYKDPSTRVSYAVDAVRATATGFTILEKSASHDELFRWQIAFDGSVIEKVLMSKHPPQLDLKFYKEVVLDGQGRALEHIPGDKISRIVRNIPNAGDSEILFENDTSDIRSLNIINFITGP